MLMSGTILKSVCAVVAAGLTTAVAYATYAYSRSWQLRHGDVNALYASLKPLRLMISGLFIAGIYFIVGKFLFDPTATAVLIGASAIGAAVTALLTRRKYAWRDAVAATILMLTLTPLMCIGVTAAASWLIPDVATVYENAPRNYHSVKAYGWIPGEGMKATGSYLDNRTADTLYRVTVSYAIPGEDLENVYSITGAYPPGTIGRMRARADYLMRPIPPFMRWSSGKTGRYRTQRVFVVDRPMLTEFIKRYDMSVFGLKPHRRVDSIRENRNRVLHEDPSRLTEYRHIIKGADARKAR